MSDRFAGVPRGQVLSGSRAIAKYMDLVDVAADARKPARKRRSAAKHTGVEAHRERASPDPPHRRHRHRRPPPPRYGWYRRARRKHGRKYRVKWRNQSRRGGVPRKSSAPPPNCRRSSCSTDSLVSVRRRWRETAQVRSSFRLKTAARADWKLRHSDHSTALSRSWRR